MRRLGVFLTTAAVIIIGLTVPAAATSPEADPGGRVLFYGPATSTHALEVRAARWMGLTPVVADASQWRALAVSGFQGFEAVVFPDPRCEVDGSTLDVAEDTSMFWNKTVVHGNIVILGNDPNYHRTASAKVLVYHSLEYAVAGKEAGLYLSLSCYYYDVGPATSLPVVDHLGEFSIGGTDALDLDDKSIRITDRHHPVMAGQTARALRWQLGVHEAFDELDPSFRAVATSNGYPYIVVRDGA